MSKIKDCLVTLEDNAITIGKYITEVFEALSDICFCKDYRLHMKMHEMRYNQDEKIDMQSMFNELKAKCYKLVRQKKWITPTFFKVDSKHMSLLSRQEVPLLQLSQKSYYVSRTNPFANNGSNGNNRSSIHREWQPPPEIPLLPAPNDEESETRQVNGRIVTYLCRHKT